MTSNIVKIIFGLVCVINIASSQLLPVDLIKCDLNDPNFEECLKNSIESALPDLAKGIPDLGLIPLDPLKISIIESSQVILGSISIGVTLNDTYIYNLALSQLVKVTFDPINYVLTIELINIDPIELGGEYEISANALDCNILAYGQFNISLNPSKTVISAQLKPIKSDGVVHFVIANLSLNFTTVNLNVTFNNYVNETEILGCIPIPDQTLSEVFDKTVPDIEKALANTIKDYVQAILNVIPGVKLPTGLDINVNINLLS